MLYVKEICERELPMAALLERKIFSDPWSEKAFFETLQSPGTIMFGAWEGERLAGYVIVYYVLDEAEIVRLAVKESCRRKGAAGQLFLKVKEFCAEKNITDIFLEVRRSNVPAITFYRKHGFQTDGIRKNFYTNPTEDAILMSSKAVK